MTPILANRVKKRLDTKEQGWTKRCPASVGKLSQGLEAELDWILTIDEGFQFLGGRQTVGENGGENFVRDSFID